MNRIEIVKSFHGICHMIVCCEKNVTDDEILNFCNEVNPSGTTGGWQTVIREDYENGKMRPVICEEYPNRLHIMVGC
jgi:hypothetical protein